uniref:DUF3074 domain-containing protein n=1 Tax=Steinernema glaseri TaxID=37863 RepID=A0A1I7XWY0_9BILA
MESVPLEFIERVVLLAHTKMDESLCSFQGRWGAHAKHLEYESDSYSMRLHLAPPSDVFCELHNISKSMGYGREEAISFADIPAKKRVGMFLVSLVRVDETPRRRPEGEKLDERKIRMLQRFISRSNGRVWLDLPVWPVGFPVAAVILRAIPRFANIRFMRSRKVEDSSAVLSLVEKKVCKSLDFGRRLIAESLFPAVRAFLKQADFHWFQGKVESWEHDFANEMVELIAKNLKDNMHRTVKAAPRAKRTLVDEKKTDLAMLPQEWVGEVAMPDAPIFPPGLEIIFKSTTYRKYTYTWFVAVMAVSPPLMDELKEAMADVADQWPGRPELLHVEYTPTHLTFACWSPV